MPLFSEKCRRKRLLSAVAAPVPNQPFVLTDFLLTWNLAAGVGPLEAARAAPRDRTGAQIDVERVGFFAGRLEHDRLVAAARDVARVARKMARPAALHLAFLQEEIVGAVFFTAG